MMSDIEIQKEPVTRDEREHKDRFFRFLFAKKEFSYLTLDLYNALNHSSYDNPDELEYL
ncbi:MAG: hypothetical protein IKF90_08785 [Parasporobacterium sp.]|nr:hypothetical protein [Parasporobacterium sp.]